MKGMILVCWDNCWRPSSQDAFGDMESIRVNTHTVPKLAPTMNESATIPLDYTNPSFKDFLLSETVSRVKIEQLCECMGIDAQSMIISEGAIHLDSVDGNVHNHVIMPLNKVVGTELHNLF